MKKVFLLLAITGFTFSFEMKCDYELGEKLVSVILRPFKNEPTGTYLKELELRVDGNSYKFSGSDFQLASMKWNDPNKIHLGALIETKSHRINFIHVGPVNQKDYYAFLDIYKGVPEIESGRYKPLGICYF